MVLQIIIIQTIAFSTEFISTTFVITKQCMASTLKLLQKLCQKTLKLIHIKKVESKIEIKVK